MALFKIVRGSEANLPAKKTDGFAYFCTDTWNFFIDFADDNGVLRRAKINANLADGLHYVSNGSAIEIDASAIALKSEVDAKVPASQGVGNYGKILAVSGDGTVSATPVHKLGGSLTWGTLAGES